MKIYSSENIRNVALVGHSGAGKTQLTSAALFNAGMVNRLGKVDDGNTVTDFDEEEISRKHTLSASVAFAEWNKKKINFIDTPGVANFLSEARAALRVTDAAIIVVDAVAGVEVQTEKVWEIAKELGLPCLLVLNRLDRERASLERALNSLRDAFGREVMPIQIPIGEEKDFSGIVDIVGMKAISFQPHSGEPTELEIPETTSAVANTARDALIEMVAEADDNLMEKFFEAGTLTQEEIETGLRIGVNNRNIFPLVCTSALENIGVQSWLDAINTYLPTPTDHPLAAVDRTTGEDQSYENSETDALSIFVWKTIADPFAGRITLFRVASGSLESDASVYNISRETTERMGGLCVLQGKEPVSYTHLTLPTKA